MQCNGRWSSSVLLHGQPIPRCSRGSLHHYIPFFFLSSLDSDSIKRCVGQVSLDVSGLTRFSRKTPKNRIIYKISEKSEIYKTQKILLFFWYAVPRCSAIRTSNAPASLSLSTRSFGFGFSSSIRKGMLPWFQSDSALLTRPGRQKKTGTLFFCRRLATINLYSPLPSSFSIAFLPGM